MISALHYIVLVHAFLSCSVSVGYGKYDSPLGANALYCCNQFDWAHDLFMLNLVDLNNCFFYKWHNNNLTDTELNTARSLLDINFFREGYSVLPDNLL